MIDLLKNRQIKMNYSTFNIILGYNADIHLAFTLVDNPITNLWIKQMELALAKYPLDDPNRFYGFNTAEEEKTKALQLIQNDINIINNYQPLINRQITDVSDQDTLNYLHKIFEDYHGILDQQNTDFWKQAPAEVRQALADLNIHVHRCETANNNYIRPRFVCTWYGLPKTVQFTHEQILQYGELNVQYGGLYINYVEIGKTLEDIFVYDDHHVGNEALRPFVHYSADFNVKLFDKQYTEEFDQQLYNCYLQHRDTFLNNGYDNFEILKPYYFKVGQLVEENKELIQQIKLHQHVKEVYFS